ncbi:cupredoxin domain-containing protein [Ottowia testudinis]|uniref:Cupredoxin family protein n=1 Tax=Ottowia testudinis TaxID=2816950 RepID=A0A975CK94_9BURK|nr:cupredoxin family protein [Ottowia testudinis]QTD46537.1 cupredoxin family protein [Ottowia testudinis]
MTKSLMTVLLAMAMPLMAQAAGSHDHSHGPAVNSAVGQPGDAAKVTRTIEVLLNDDMRFKPETIEVKQGETVRFFVKNQGAVQHEMVLGTLAELKEHAEMMRKMPDMKHSDPNAVNLQPGQRGGMVWQFTQTGTVDFACTVPGHMEAGMVGKVIVSP